jgi:hypothetical protein
MEMDHSFSSEGKNKKPPPETFQVKIGCEGRKFQGVVGARCGLGKMRAARADREIPCAGRNRAHPDRPCVGILSPEKYFPVDYQEGISRYKQEFIVVP